MMDNVFCTNCGSNNVIKHGLDVCPDCLSQGTLQWNYPEEVGEDFYESMNEEISIVSDITMNAQIINIKIGEKVEFLDEENEKWKLPWNKLTGIHSPRVLDSSQGMIGHNINITIEGEMEFVGRTIRHKHGTIIFVTKSGTIVLNDKNVVSHKKDGEDCEYCGEYEYEENSVDENEPETNNKDLERLDFLISRVRQGELLPKEEIQQLNIVSFYIINEWTKQELDVDLIFKYPEIVKDIYCNTFRNLDDIEIDDEDEEDDFEDSSNSERGKVRHIINTIKNNQIPGEPELENLTEEEKEGVANFIKRHSKLSFTLNSEQPAAVLWTKIYEFLSIVNDEPGTFLNILYDDETVNVSNVLDLVESNRMPYITDLTKLTEEEKRQVANFLEDNSEMDAKFRSNNTATELYVFIYNFLNSKTN